MHNSTKTRLARIAAALLRGPMTITEIARRAGTNWRGAYRVLAQAEAAGLRIVRLRRSGGGYVFQAAQGGDHAEEEKGSRDP